MGSATSKWFYVLGFCVVCSVSVMAQPRLTVSSLPAPSKSFVMRLADTVGVKVGLSGSNVIWDFTGLQPRTQAPDTVAFQYLLPSAAPIQAANLFPTAQVAVRTGVRYEFYRTEGTMFRLLGEWTPSSSLTSGTANPYDTRPVEITYGGQHIDQYKSVFNTQSPPTTQQRAGTHRIIYDGFGRIRLPNGEVSSIARTRTTTNTTDTARFTTPTPRVVITTTDIDSYRWAEVNSNVPWVIVNFTTIRVTNNGQPVSTSTTREVLFRDTTTQQTDVELDNTDNAGIYPNPMHSGERMYVQGIQGEVVQAELVGLQGQSFSVPATQSATGLVVIPLSNIAPGAYALVLRSSGGSVHALRQRIVVLP